MPTIPDNLLELARIARIRNALGAVCKLGEDSSCGSSTTLYRPLTEPQLHLIETLLDDDEDEAITAILDYLEPDLTLKIININNSLKFKLGVSYGLNEWANEWVEWLDYAKFLK